MGELRFLSPRNLLPQQLQKGIQHNHKEHNYRLNVLQLNLTFPAPQVCPEFLQKPSGCANGRTRPPEKKSCMRNIYHLSSDPMAELQVEHLTSIQKTQAQILAGVYVLFVLSSLLNATHASLCSTPVCKGPPSQAS